MRTWAGPKGESSDRDSLHACNWNSFICWCKTQMSAVRNGNWFVPGQCAPQSSESSIYDPVSPISYTGGGKPEQEHWLRLVCLEGRACRKISVKSTWVLTEWVISSEIPSTNLPQVWSSLRWQIRHRVSEAQFLQGKCLPGLRWSISATCCFHICVHLKVQGSKLKEEVIVSCR